MKKKSPEEIKSAFGKRLRYALYEKGLAQKDLVKHLNVQKMRVSNWVNGVNLPRPEEQEQIAAFLGMTVSELMHGPEVPDAETLGHILEMVLEETQRTEHPLTPEDAKSVAEAMSVAYRYIKEGNKSPVELIRLSLANLAGGG